MANFEVRGRCKEHSVRGVVRAPPADGAMGRDNRERGRTTTGASQLDIKSPRLSDDGAGRSRLKGLTPNLFGHSCLARALTSSRDGPIDFE
jgi:hypothetical protein